MNQQAGIRSLILYEATSKTSFFAVDASTISAMSTSGDSVEVSYQMRPVLKMAFASIRPLLFSYSISFKIFDLSSANQAIIDQIRNKKEGWYAVMTLNDGSKKALDVPVFFDESTSLDNNVSNHYDISLSPRVQTASRIKSYYTLYVPGLLDFDSGVYINYPAIDVTGSQSIKFYLYASSEYVALTRPLMYFGNDINDQIYIELYQDTIRISSGNTSWSGRSFDFTEYYDRLCYFEIEKSTSNIDSIKINNTTITGSNNLSYGFSNEGYHIGKRAGFGILLSKAYIWDVQIGDSFWDGQPAGDTNEAWKDRSQAANGVIVGTAETYDLIIE